MNVTRFEPWSLINLMHRDLGQTGGRRYGLAESADNGDSDSVANWVPAVDIVEEKDRFVLRADVPGVDPKDIEVTMEKGILTVRGERRLESQSEGEEGYRRVERAYGSFYRRFSLPDTADAEGISAASNHGVLEVVIPKRAAVQPKRIKVAA